MGLKWRTVFCFFANDRHGFVYGASPSCSLMARSSTFRHVGSFDTSFRRVEDLDFAIRLALAGGYFIWTKGKLFSQYATEASDKSYDKNLEAEQMLVKKHASYLKKRGYYMHAKLWPKLRFYHFKKRYMAFFATLLTLFFYNPIHTIMHLLKTGSNRIGHEKCISSGG